MPVRLMPLGRKPGFAQTVIGAREGAAGMIGDDEPGQRVGGRPVFVKSY